MKLSKTLLQTIAVGITMGTISSCALFEDSSEVHFKTCDESCEVDHSEKNNENETYDCPACGMG